MTDPIERRLRDADERAGAGLPPALRSRIRTRIADEDQTPDPEGFELRRFGPVVGAVALLVVAAPFLARRAPQPTPEPGTSPVTSLVAGAVTSYTDRVDGAYRAELDGIRADASRIGEMVMLPLRRMSGR